MPCSLCNGMCVNCSMSGSPDDVAEPGSQGVTITVHRLYLLHYVVSCQFFPSASCLLLQMTKLCHQIGVILPAEPHLSPRHILSQPELKASASHLAQRVLPIIARGFQTSSSALHSSQAFSARPSSTSSQEESTSKTAAITTSQYHMDIPRAD